MLHISDVWVNWAEAEENAYNIPEYFEWDADDALTCLDITIAIHVTSDFLAYVEDGLAEIPEACLELLEQHGFGTHFILSDGKRALAVDTLGYEVPIRKSRMEPKKEGTLLSHIVTQPLQEFPYQPLKKEYDLWNPGPETMIGLTRKERARKEILLQAIDEFQNEEKAKILYFYIEFNPSAYERVKNEPKQTIYERFVCDAMEGWNGQHEELLQLFVKENEHIADIYLLTT